MCEHERLEVVNAYEIEDDPNTILYEVNICLDCDYKVIKSYLFLQNIEIADLEVLKEVLTQDYTERRTP